ncbi:CENP-B N-terminal DNA-binding domain [Popillia japonica]|uniref:CENP-B N-terminal DNA-binding domain n=1 Tax=Popillia japonica TaxID=7064 RepID=A0AAW1MHE6_POPJA
MSDVENDRRKRKKKGTWNPTNMRKAVEKVINNEMSARQAADRYQVPRTTLNDRISVIKRGKEMSIEPLMEDVKDLANRLRPLNRNEFLYLVFQLAKKLKLSHQFNKEKKSAGKNFYYSFMKRHSALSLRIPESTNLMRAVGFNRPLASIVQKHAKVLAESTNLMRAVGFNRPLASIVQKHAKVLASKNQKQVGKRTSAERGKNVTVLIAMSAGGAERGKNVTVLIAMSAGGQFVPPFFVFPRSRMNERLVD